MQRDPLDILDSILLPHTAASEEPPDPANRVKTAVKLWRDKHPEISVIANRSFIKRKFDGVDFERLTFTNVAFQDCTFNSTIFRFTKFENVKFIASELITTVISSADFQFAKLTSSDLRNCYLQAASFERASIENCNLTGSNLRSAVFDQATLIDSDFRNVELNSATSFRNLHAISNVAIDRYSLACLGSSLGQLTEGNRMKMRIVDDALTLRRQFGGIWTLIHLAAITIFLFPYAWFLAQQWAVASFNQFQIHDRSMPLWQALIGFIYTGGGNWRTPWYQWQIEVVSLISFVVFAIYNAARFALLWKTKQLETQEEIIGLPVEFSLQGSTFWWVMFWAVRVGFWFALVAAAANTYHFLTMRVPLGSDTVVFA